MTRSKLMAGLAVVVAAISVAGAGEDKTWVTAEDRTIVLDGKDAVFGEGAEVLNVADLRDGESRTVGSGEKQVTVSRTGDNVTIRRDANGGDGRMEIDCDVTRDSCKIMTIAGDPEKVMIMVEKTRECVNGVGDCGNVAHVDVAEGGKHHVVIRKVKCDDAGNCNEVHEVVGGVAVQADGPHAVFVRKAFDDSKVHLACPEGDATLHVDQEEAEDVFLCPKHNVPLERLEPKVVTVEVDD
jgi:hypothetical protein